MKILKDVLTKVERVEISAMFAKSFIRGEWMTIGGWLSLLYLAAVYILSLLL